MDKSKLRFKGKIEGNKFIPNENNAFRNYVQSFEGQEVFLQIKKWRNYKKRSNQENKYYWSVVVQMLSDELGYTPDEMHEAIKYQFLAEPKEVKIKTGKKMLIFPGSTATLSTTDFETLMSKIRSWASMELGIFIPEPNHPNLEY